MISRNLAGFPGGHSSAFQYSRAGVPRRTALDHVVFLLRRGFG